MSKILRFVLGLLLTLTAVESAVRQLSAELGDPRPWPSIETQVKADHLSSPERDPQVVFLGTSITEAAIDPTLFASKLNIESYNAALPFSTPVSLRYWLEEFVLTQLSPHTVVIGLPRWGAPATAQEDPIQRGLSEVVERTASVAGRSALLSRRQQIRELPDVLIQPEPPTDLWTEAGHQTLYYDGADAARRGVVEGSAFDSSFSGDQVDALEAMVDLIRTRGIRPVFLLEPGDCPPSLTSCPASESLAVQQVETLSRDLNVPLIDGAEFVAQDDWYADSVHFNRTGTRAFTLFMVDRLGGLLDLDRSR